MKILTTSLCIALTFGSAKLDAAGHPVTDKFEKVFSSMMKDIKGKSFEEFLAREDFSFDDWSGGLANAMTPSTKLSYLAVLFEAYLIEKTKNMDPRQRASDIWAAAAKIENNNALARTLPTLLEAYIDSRNKYFPVDGGDLDRSLRIQMAARAAAAIKDPLGDRRMKIRWDRFYSAIETDPAALALHLRESNSKASIEGVASNASLAGKAEVIDALVETSEDKRSVHEKVGILSRLCWASSVSPESKTKIRRKLASMAEQSEDPQMKERIGLLLQRIEDKNKALTPEN